MSARGAVSKSGHRHVALPTRVKPAELRIVPALEGCSDTELEMFALVAPVRRFSAGSPLIEQGELGDSCFLLLSGELEVTQTINGEMLFLETALPGAIVGQVALVDQAPRSASVTATADSVAVEIQRDVFERLLETNGRFAVGLLEHIAVAGIRQLRRATERLGEIIDQRSGGQRRTVSQHRRLNRVRAALREWSVDVYGPSGGSSSAPPKPPRRPGRDDRSE